MPKKKRSRRSSAPATAPHTPEKHAAELAPRSPRRISRALIVGSAFVIFAVGAIAAWQLHSTPQRAVLAAIEPTFVGSAACASCHPKQYEAWQHSQHAHAMQPATDATVRGDFGNAKFRYGDVESRFAKRDAKLVVRTDAPDGKLAEFDVKYTFGVEPLQQYLVELPGGRLQALSIAWDTRKPEQGGGRWFHLYPDQKIDAHDELHWTRRAQNWNFMCADCHSTDVRKNYDAATDTFKTTWTEIAVGCEACHGPGSAHVVWARSNGKDAAKGLTAALDERRRAHWTIDAASGNALRSPEARSDSEIEICAPCHARRAQIAEGWHAGKRFLDHYSPALLEPSLYHADGQQRDEVYIWGSFLQSKMHRRGVTCADCHEPHGAKLRLEGNALCGQCHLGTKYDSTAHHHHATAGPGTQCVDCHMPATNYMVIDARRDHSLRIPRPDLAASLGTPNACNGCHRDKTAQWAADTTKQWFGHAPEGFQRYAGAFAAAQQGDARAGPNLAAIVADISQPAIARASALATLARVPASNAIEIARRGSIDADPLVRRASIGVLASLPPDQRWSAIAPLLTDPLRAIRIDAAAALADSPPVAANPAWQRAVREFEETQRYLADRPEARTALATFHARQRRFADAEAEFRSALSLEPTFVPAYVNLADLYRMQERDGDAERVLREGLVQSPQNPVLHHTLALALVRMGRKEGALASFRRAAELAPDDPHFAYVYAVALNSAQKSSQAIAELERALARHPDDRELLSASIDFRRDAGDDAGATRYARRYAERYPEDARTANAAMGSK